MIPRTRFDIGWRDLLYGFRQLPWPGDRLEAQHAVEAWWSDNDDCLACLSLRSGFDVVLEAYDFPPGGEVIMSCLNIGPMAEIVESYGLKPIPIDLDMDTLEMRRDLLDEAISDRTVAIVHAHVLGTRRPLDTLRDLADRHGLVLFEDCAQAYRADGWQGDPRADVTMFSFGPLKTCSATMGGIVRFSDDQVHQKARELQKGRPVQGRYQFFDRLMLFAELLCVTQEGPYTMMMGLARRLGLEEFVNAPVRNFRGRNQMRKLRKQPGYPLMKLLLHRLKTYDPGIVARRIGAAETVLDRIPTVSRPGSECADHGYWLFPICTDDPVGLRRRLHAEGIDSTLGHKAFVVLEPPADRPEFTPHAALDTMRRSLYLPIHFRVSAEDLVRLADVIREFDPQCVAAGPETIAPEFEPTPAAAVACDTEPVEAVTATV